MDVEKPIEHLLSLQAGHDARIQILEEKQTKSEVLTHQLIGLMSQLANRQAKDVREIRVQIQDLSKEVKSLTTAVKALISRNGRKN